MKRSDCGGKAAGLRLLGELGFSVPRWFCVSASVFRSVAGPAARSFHRRLARARPDDRQSIETICLESAEAASAAISRELAKGKMGAFALVSAAAASVIPSADSFAIRSSACAEDAPEASFAGQFDSFLNVRLAEIGDAVARCWMGYFKPSAALYRLTCGLSGRAEGMAVIIQEMVDAACSGVAFSVNPCGDLGTILINAVRGSGQDLLAGKAIADSYSVDRASLALRGRTFDAGQAAAAAPGVQGPGSAEGNAPVLDEELVRGIATLCLEAERGQGAWADVEWAYDGKLRALQLRPATGMPPGPVHILDNSNIIESYPGVSSPLTFSFARQAYEALFRNLSRRVGISEKDLAKRDVSLDGMVVHFMGRIYYDLGNWYALYSVVPFSSRIVAAWERMLGIRPARPNRRAHRVQSILLKPARILHGFSMMVRIVSELTRLDSSVRRLLARFDAMEADFESRAREGIGESEIEPLYRQLTQRMLDGWELTLLNDSFAFDLTAIAQRLISNVCPGSDPSEIFNGLLCGLEGLESLEPARLAVGLAAMLRASPSLIARARAAVDAESARVAFDGAAESAKDDATRFDAAFDEYLRRYGARSVEELKLETPSYTEAPWTLLRRIAGYAAGEITVSMMKGRELEVHERARSALANGSPSPLSRLLLALCLRLAGRAISRREASRLRRCRFFRMVRRIFLSQASILSARRVISSPGDIFYLTVDEALSGSTSGQSGPGLREVVDARKAAAAQCAGLTPPERILWKGDLGAAKNAVVELLANNRNRGTVYPGNTGEVPEQEKAEGFIQGIGCSPGSVRAAALVVTDPNTVAETSGKILVACSTDPGWVFLLIQAAGLVVEKGSPLSHTAIIARELGIPTIVGALDATRRIRTGDMIDMEGGSGRVLFKRGGGRP